MSLTIDELETPRSPPQLRDFVEQVRTSVRADRAEFELGMAKRGYYKEFLDEVVLLCNFAEVAYPASYKVQPVLSSQGYDAIVFDADGNECDRVEFAKPHDGAAMARIARQVLTQGYSDMQICDYTEILNDYIPFFEITSKAKSRKDYSGITVVFALAAPPALAGLESAFEQQVERLRGIIVENKFNAKRVFLYIPPHHLLQIHGEMV